MMSYFYRKKRFMLGMSLVLIFTATPLIAKNTQINDYMVGPGDVLDIRVWDHEDLNRVVEISQEGAFSFPFVGIVEVSNHSVVEIEKELAQKLSDGYIVAPQVTISVSEYRNQKVFVFGEVNRPGSYILKHKSHLLEIISEAGGFTGQRGTVCTIVRPEKTVDKIKPTSIKEAKENEIIKIDLDLLISGSKENPPFYISPGDSIYVDESEKIFVTGEVQAPGQFRWKKGLTVRQAVSLAGGGTPRASLNRIRIIRTNQGEESTFKPNLGDPVLPDDIIKVPESFF